MNKHTYTITLAAACSLFMPGPAAQAQGTAFSYQGRLNTASGTATGTYDLTFTLFNTNAGGILISGPVTNSAVSVSNGLFTVAVDFGSAPFTLGQPLWLEIGARTNGAATFSTLVPRQTVLTTPIATFAESANAASLIGQVTDANLATTFTSPHSFNNAANSFTGNGSGLVGVNAAQLGGIPSSGFWKTNGNIGANPTNGAFLGTADNLPLEVRVNNQRVLRLESVNDGGFAHPVVNVIGGYVSNSVAAGVDGATIAGGGGSDVNFGWVPNTVISSFATIGGGFGNTAGGLAGTIGGGYYNVTGPGSVTGVEFVGGGYTNVASGDAAVIVGGFQNTASGDIATIGGGAGNLANGRGAVIGGGGYDGSSVAGSTASGSASVVGGGFGNQATGAYATVPGGAANVAGGKWSLAAGQQAQALNPGTFVWADSLGGVFASTSSNQFLIRAQGGVGIGTASPAKQLDVTGNASSVAGGSSIDPSIFVRVNNTATDGNTSSPDYAGIGFGHNSTRQAIVGGTFGNDYLDFYTGGLLTSPKMRIDFNGHVGIGTTNPTSALQVNGTITATAFSGTGSGLTGVALLAGGNALTGQQTVMSGNVGIGTTTPANLLDVHGSADFGGSVGINATKPQTPLEVYSPTYAFPAAQFDVANCGLVCAQTDYQEAIRLWNQNGNGQVGLGFLIGQSSFNSNAVPDVWIGTDYAGAGNGNNVKIATRTAATTTNLIDRVYVNGTTGNVGIGTDSPGAKLTVNSGAYGIEQTDGNVLLSTYIDSTGGWLGTVNNYPLNFYVNNGFQSMTINTNGNVGINTTTPLGQFTVATSDGQLSVVGGPFTPELWSTGGQVPGHMRFRNALEVWPNTNATAAGYLDVRGTNTIQSIILDGSDGNVTCVAVNITSDRNAKEDFTALSPRDVLAKIATLPITEWQYKAEKAGDAAAARHIGPMAQDFSAAFALGHDDKHISIVDEGGVALAAIQGLNQKLEEQARDKDARIQELEKSVNDLKELVGRLAVQPSGGAK